MDVNVNLVLVAINIGVDSVPPFFLDEVAQRRGRGMLIFAGRRSIEVNADLPGSLPTGRL